MHQLSAILSDATSHVPDGYFQVQVDDSDPVYRERVYCYELYHQMRRLWPADSKYYLNGELDKAAHPILRELGAAHAKPDLLIHRPGYMTGNHAIMEVKTCNAQTVGIKKDLETLSLFLHKVKYERAIYLFFGYGAATALQRVRAAAKTVEDLGKIELWAHTGPGASATYEGDA